MNFTKLSRTDQENELQSTWGSNQISEEQKHWLDRLEIERMQKMQKFEEEKDAILREIKEVTQYYGGTLPPDVEEEFNRRWQPIAEVLVEQYGEFLKRTEEDDLAELQKSVPEQRRREPDPRLLRVFQILGEDIQIIPHEGRSGFYKSPKRDPDSLI